MSQSQKKIKRNKGSDKGSKKKIVELDVQSGEGYYGVVEKVFGDKYVSVKLNDGTTKHVKIPGKFWKKVWVKNGTKVLVNNEMEIVKIIRDNDIKSAEADRMLRSSKGDDYNIFQNYSDSESDDEIDQSNNLDKSKEEIKKTDNINKTKELLARKEKEKNKDMERKGGRIMRDEDEIAKDINDLLNQKSNSDNVDLDDINIDDI